MLSSTSDGGTCTRIGATVPAGAAESMGTATTGGATCASASMSDPGTAMMHGVHR